VAGRAVGGREDRLRNERQQTPENQSLVYHLAYRTVSDMEAMS
jgi:hypothetical protein